MIRRYSSPGFKLNSSEVKAWRRYDESHPWQARRWPGIVARVPESTVRRWVAKGVKRGKLWLIPASELETILKAEG